MGTDTLFCALTGRIIERLSGPIKTVRLQPEEEINYLTG